MKMYKWTVEIGISDTWVADGFDLNEDAIIEMLQERLHYARQEELSAKILKAPKRSELEKEWSGEKRRTT